MTLEQSLKIKPVENCFREGRFLEIANDARNPNSTNTLFNDAAQMNYIKANPGEIGGNHYHHIKKETMVVLEGRALVALENPETKEKYRIEIDKGHLCTLEPEIAHAITSASPNEPVRYLEITNKAFDPENQRDDIYPYRVIDNCIV